MEEKIKEITPEKIRGYSTLNEIDQERIKQLVNAGGIKKEINKIFYLKYYNIKKKYQKI